MTTLAHETTDVTSAPRGFRPALLSGALAVYAACTLLSMATMSLGAFLVALALVVWGSQSSRFRSCSSLLRSPVLGRYAWVSILLAAACVTSLLGLEFTPIRFEGFDKVRVRWGGDLAKLWYFAWAPVLAMALSSLQGWQETRVWRTWVAVFGVVSVVGCLQFFTGWPRPQGIPGLEGHYHATMFLGHHLSTASIWIFPFFAVLAGVFSKPLREHWSIDRRLLVVASVLGGAVLLLSFSRMLWIALPLGLFFFALVFHRGLRIGQLLFIGVAMVVAISAAWQVPAVRERMLNSMGTGERFALWKANWQFFLDRPLTGSGWHHNLELAGQYLTKASQGAQVFVGHAHNNLIDVIGSLGILGLMTWMAWNIWLIVELVRIGFGSGTPPWARDLGRAWLAAFLVFHLNGLTQVNFWEGKVQHQLFWVVAWVLLWRHRYEHHTHARPEA